jgi:hypothetical protein
VPSRWTSRSRGKQTEDLARTTGKLLIEMFDWDQIEVAKIKNSLVLVY